MKKSESQSLSEKPGRTRKAKDPNKRGSIKKFAPEVEQWMADEGASFPSSQSSIIPML
ncbi:MAG: hypothetical protein HON65_01030, partial [Rhodospirillales bacterium]|nr:hypothetical protein [Rhodospirillales bacterium]